MTLNVTSYGDNPQIPGISSETYIPDQLIAGNLKLVTDTVTLTGGALLPRGSVLGMITLGAPTAAVNTAGNTGNGVISAITLGQKAKIGPYTVRFSGALAYQVIDPNGIELTQGFAAGAYADPQIGFTFTAGATPMAAGDTITFSVPAGSGSYKLATAAATDGSQNPVAVLVDTTDASGGDVTCGVYLMGEFNGNYMTLGAGITIAAVKAALRALGMFVKTPITAVDPS